MDTQRVAHYVRNAKNVLSHVEDASVRQALENIVKALEELKRELDASDID